MKVEVGKYKDGKGAYIVYNDDGKEVNNWPKEYVDFIAIDSGMAKFRSNKDWKDNAGVSLSKGEVFATNSLGEVVRLNETI